MNSLHVTSEIGKLDTVLLKRPGKEFLYLTPRNMNRLLFDDIPYLEEAQTEHDSFADALRRNGVRVVYLDELLEETLRESSHARDFIVNEWVNGIPDSCPADTGDIRDGISDLNFSHWVESLVETMISGAMENHGLYAGDVDPIPNLYFTRDTFTVIGNRVLFNAMSTETRRREAIFFDTVLRYNDDYSGHTALYANEHRGNRTRTIEGGDILILSSDTLAIGMSERTQLGGVLDIAKWIFGDEESGFRKILAFTVPRARACMHLDTVITQLDTESFVCYKPWANGTTVYEITPGKVPSSCSVSELDGEIREILASALRVPSVRLIYCGGGDEIAGEREQWSDGSNVLAIEPGKVISYDRNRVTNHYLDIAGIEVIEIPSGELSRGRGGAHCMSMPLVRQDI